MAAPRFWRALGAMVREIGVRSRTGLDPFPCACGQAVQNCSARTVRDAEVVVPPLGVQNCPLRTRGNHAMPKEPARESNVFELNAGKRERIDKGFKEPFKEPNEIPESVRHQLAERTDAALDQRMTTLNGRRLGPEP